MLKMFFERKNNSWLFVGVLLVCFAVSAGVRYQQFETWEKTPAAYFFGERPMMTTLDAPYWLRWAREYNEETYGKKKDLANFPEGTGRVQKFSMPSRFSDSPPTIIYSPSETPEIRYSDIPLLSFLIAQIAPFFNHNYYLAGTLLIPVLASLFIFPLGIYFFRIGVPLAGLLGGLIGTFASGYYMRSSIGRIDTDMLNLFFPVLASLLILLATQSKSERSVLLYSAGAGLSLFLFHWWYSQAGFTLGYFVILVFSLFVHRKQLQIILLSALLFLLCAHPSVIMDGTKKVQGQFNKYFVIEEADSIAVIENGTTPATFPNTLTTISEVNHVSMEEVMQRILSNTTLGWIGFLAFFGLAFFRWRVLFPLVLMLTLGLLSFQSSNRFIMFLGPFIGIGLGWLLQLVIEGIFFLITKNIHHRGVKVKGERGKVKGSLLEGSEIDWFGWSRQGTLYLGMGVFFWGISSQTAISFVPVPSINPRIYTTFLEVKKRVLDESKLLTWWDYGHTLNDVGLGTFHDGGSQTSPTTYFIARGLISADPEELYDITQYLATEGNRGITENNTSPEALLAAVRDPKLKPWDPIYLFFTADMTGKYGAISKLGSWDIVKGGSKSRGYQNLVCNKITNAAMDCRGAKIDLKAGKINNQVALKRMVFIRDGKVLREQEFRHTQGYSLQLLVAGNQIVEVQLIDEVVFLSNYNQMFLLGRYREDLYEETYNAFPFSRLYRVKY